LSSLFFLFWDSIFLGSSIGLKLMVLPQPPQSWDYGWIPPLLTNTSIFKSEQFKAGLWLAPGCLLKLPPAKLQGSYARTLWALGWDSGAGLYPKYA
jgi:hypothetical protein